MLVAVGRGLAEDGLFAGGGGSFGACSGVFIASRIPCIAAAGAGAGAGGLAIRVSIAPRISDISAAGGASIVA